MNETPGGGREVLDFGKGWRFCRGEQPYAQYASFPDDDWREISVPHDWSIEGPFDKDCPTGGRAGYLPAGIGWYRKRFRVPFPQKEKKVEIEFEGIFRRAKIWVNGILIGYRPNGYVCQRYDITPFLYGDDQENLIAVRVDNSDQPASRYYTGSGIYRPVNLIVRGELFIENLSPFITTQSVEGQEATLCVETTVVNGGREEKNVRLAFRLCAPDGGIAAQGECLKGPLGGNGARLSCRELLRVEQPVLWDVEHPCLYTLYTYVYDDAGIADASCDRIGIRTIRFSQKEGFLLNEKKVFLKGVCLHHDNGCLGGVANRCAEERKLRIMKEMGCNSVRLSHNPFSRGFLELCDEMGILVMDEAFDEWRLPKCIMALRPDDMRYRVLIHNYYMDFDEWHERDLESMILHDRNHPSIILYSIGNEIAEQRYNAYEAVSTARMLAETVRKLDNSRPVTCACCFGIPGCAESGFAQELDVVGYNYGEVRYAEHDRVFPGKPFVGSETTSLACFRKRGSYDPNVNDKIQAAHVGEGGEILETEGMRIRNAEDSMRRHLQNPQAAGMYIWTGMDYLGEPTPYTWPSRSSYFGVTDTCGFKKDSFYFYQACWTKEPMVHIAVHWNWEGYEGKEIDVIAYTNCERAELFLNGTSVGICSYDGEKNMHLHWRIPYRAGSLRAVGYREGKACCEDCVHTAGAACAIRLSADRHVLRGASRELSYVTAEIVDREGYRVPIGQHIVRFTAEDGLKIRGVDNGDPEYTGSLQDTQIPSLAGLCLAVVGENGIPGEYLLYAEANGLSTDRIPIHIRE